MTMPTRMSIWLDQAWLARYLSHQLSGDELAWFEAYMLDKPELLAMIEADTQLRDTIAANPDLVQSLANGTPAPAKSKADGPGGIGETRAAYNVATINPPRRALPAWFAMVGMLVIGCGVGVAGMNVLVTKGPSVVVTSPTRIVFDTLRGSTSAARVEHADSTSPLVLVEVAIPPGAEQITLTIDGEPPYALASAPDGFVSFLMVRKFLEAEKPAIQYRMNGERKSRVLAFPSLKER